MKKILLTSLLLIFSIAVWGDDAISSFSMSHITDKKYDVYVSISDNKKEFGFVVFGESKEKNGLCGLFIKDNALEDFINSLKNTEAKFQEWSATAKENKVTNFEKIFDIQTPRIYAFFKYGSSLHVTKKCRFKLKFKVTEDGDCLYCIESGTLYSNSNAFASHDGFLFAFNSVEEIEKFIKALDTSKVFDRESQMKKNNDLFK